MAKEIRVDVKENKILEMDASLLSILLKDNSSGKNLIWATDNYADRGIGYQPNDQIMPYAIIGRNGSVIKPRVEKSKEEKALRIKQKAEVFTPSWVCNSQNNLVDESWFGRKDVFNTTQEKSWIATDTKIVFPTEEGKSWQDYVKTQRLEITCGEAPYLVSRYDTVTGEQIPVPQRIGLLDRKLRVVSENTDNENDWILWTTEAIKSVYGYDWQGDNVLLARENLLYTFYDYYEWKFGKTPNSDLLVQIAEIIAWNIWQMDGLKFVIPNSCHKEESLQLSFFEEPKTCECEGCKKNDPNKHNGIYCYVMDWDTKKKMKFVSLIRR